ncbi:hypothetical protein CDAR_471211 [Caerostris darwini]|uniref:Uncharacterized protein n=1 Tax=Caerostris darwini TaxID=1538125 RepID=A0AAV4QLN9_9ARAC|nr:hypothetical protein CDAR_471211 [Caerostris darwini]
MILHFKKQKNPDIIPLTKRFSFFFSTLTTTPANNCNSTMQEARAQVLLTFTRNGQKLIEEHTYRLDYKNGHLERKKKKRATLFSHSQCKEEKEPLQSHLPRIIASNKGKCSL